MCKKGMAFSMFVLLLTIVTHWSFAHPSQKKFITTPRVMNDKNSTDRESVIETNESWMSRIRKGIAEREYHVSHNGVGLQAPNRANNLRIYFSKHGIGVKDRTATDGPELLGLRLTEIDRVEEDGAKGTSAGLLDDAKVLSRDNRVDIKREGLTEWYINNPSGLEHGFTLPSRLDGHGELRLSMKVSAAEAKLEGEHIIFSTPSDRKLKYGDLYVKDANGKDLFAVFHVPDPRTVQILIKDRDACYPVIIDPLLTGIPDAMVESNQASACLGRSVSSAGDVNGDGYGDVIVGAYKYDNGQPGEGAAFIYHGGEAGISTVAATMVASNNYGAGLGLSVSGAGDVNGDGYADVIAGAPYYNNNQPGEGAFYVYHGSAAGVLPTAITMVESNQASTILGISVSGAGDVNGDGYADVIVGADSFDNGETNEGAAFIYHGSAAGISSVEAAMVESNQAEACLGRSVSGAGDVNGDGFADVIIGAINYDKGENNEGAAFIYYGGPTGISFTGGDMVESNQADAHLGTSVSGAGDVNGDGYADVFAGANGYDNGETNEGGAYIYHGSASGISTFASTLLESNQSYAHFGYSVSDAGDLNGDGYGDVIVGAPWYKNAQIDEGAAFVFLGSAQGVSPLVSTIVESDQNYAVMGYSATGAGDVNGDGYADVIVGAHNYNNGEANEGAAFVYHGGASGVSSAAAAALESDQQDAMLGWSVSDAGDVNGDGYGDVILGAPVYDDGQIDEGAVFIYHGSAQGVSTLAAAMMTSDQDYAGLGYCVSGAGDVNGDGFADVIAGAPQDEGAAFIYHGSAVGINSSAATMVESDQNSANLGWNVSGAGDVNGDGYADVIVGAPMFDNGQTDEGVAFIYHGGAAGISAVAAAMLEQDQAYSILGYAVSDAGDVNGDGFADVIVGATGFDNGQTDEGAAFVYHGGAAGVSTIPSVMLESDQDYANLGTSVSRAGDVNGDGFSDVIVGAWRFGNGQVCEGAAFVHHGGAAGVSAVAAALLEPNQDYAFMGYGGVSGAGDVNGDGFADVIVGAPCYDNGQIDEGAAFVYHGSVAGVSTLAAALIDSDQDGALLGNSVSGAGDVNGDGFTDVIVGISNYDNGQIDEGVARVYHGNSNGRPVLPNQLRGGSGTAPVPPWGVSCDTDDFKVRMIATHPEGRGRVKLQVEYCGPGVPFGDIGCGTVTSSTWTYVPVGGTGVTLTETIPGLTTGTLYRWRARVLYATESVLTPPANPSHGPWRRLAGQSAEADIRVGDVAGDSLETDVKVISASTGGVVNFALNAGTGNAGRTYLLLGGITGTSPGIPLPGGQVTLPLNWDPFTSLIINLLNTPVFHNFMGTLDGTGEGNAQLNTFGPFTSGGLTKLYFAFLLVSPYDFVSNPVTIDIVP